MRVRRKENWHLGERRQRHADVSRKNQTGVRIEFVLEFLRERFVRPAMTLIDAVRRKRRRERKQNERDEYERGELRDRMSP